MLHTNPFSKPSFTLNHLPMSPRLRTLLPLLMLFAASCSRDKEEPPPKPSAAPTQAPAPVSAANTARTFRVVQLTGSSSLVELEKEFGPEGMQLLYRLNRRDLKHLKSGDSVVVPTTHDSILAYSPFPHHIDGLDSVAKLIAVSRRVQAFGLYEHGRLVRWGPTSTGKKSTPTPEGLYHTNWKSKETHSTVDETWVMKWYFNLDNMEGISMHEYDLPGYPASHSCVRLLADDAEWIYHWADQWQLTPDRSHVAVNGTPVIIFGNYQYGKTPPWKILASDPHATQITTEELKRAISTYLP